MSRIRATDQLRALQARARELQQDLAAQEVSRRQLLIRDGLLHCMCESLSFIQLCLASSIYSPAQQQEQQQQQQHQAVREEEAKFGQLLQSEVKLLEQLSSKKHLGVSQPLAQVLVPEEGTICPATDPMAYLHRFVSRPPIEGAETMTAEDLARIVQKCTQSVSIKLHQLSTSTGPCEQAGMLEQIAAVWDRYMHAMGSLVMLGRQDMIERSMNINLETMAYEPAEAAAHQQAQAAVLAPMLDLSEQQQEYIAVGMQLYFDLVAAIHQQRQEVNSQMTAATERPDMTTSSSRMSVDGSREVSTPTSASSSERLETLPDAQELLEKQQQLTERLNLLLHKEYKLRLAGMGWFIGTLTYGQLSRLAVMSFPYAPRVLFLATEIMQQRQLLQQRRQQLSS